jgi:hypothetical protein
LENYCIPVKQGRRIREHRNSHATQVGKRDSEVGIKTKSQVREIAHAKAASVEAQIADLKITLLQSVKVIQTRIGQEHGKISRLESFMETMRPEATRHASPFQTTSKLEEKIKAFEEKLEDNSKFKSLEDKINALSAPSVSLASDSGVKKKSIHGCPCTSHPMTLGGS